MTRVSNAFMQCLYPDCDEEIGDADIERAKRLMVAHINTHPEAHVLIACACTPESDFLVLESEETERFKGGDDKMVTHTTQKRRCPRCDSRFNREVEPEPEIMIDEDGEVIGA